MALWDFVHAGEADAEHKICYEDLLVCREYAYQRANYSDPLSALNDLRRRVDWVRSALFRHHDRAKMHKDQEHHLEVCECVTCVYI